MNWSPDRFGRVRIVRIGADVAGAAKDKARRLHYSLTEDGASSKPVFRALIDWGNRRIATGRVPAKNCGVED